jgi:hypothetical protein
MTVVLSGYAAKTFAKTNFARKNYMAASRVMKNVLRKALKPQSGTTTVGDGAKGNVGSKQDKATGKKYTGPNSPAAPSGKVSPMKIII